MKILQLHNQYKFLGGEDVVLKIEKNLLINKGHSVDQIVRKNTDEIKNFFDNLNVLKNLHYSHKSIKILKNKIDKNNLPDIVHVHNLFPLWTYSIFNFFKEYNIPIVMTLHNYRIIWDYFGILDNKSIDYGHFKNSKIKTFIISKLISRKKKLLDHVDRFIVFSEFNKNEFIKFGLSSKKIIVRPNYIVDKKFQIKKFIEKDDAIFASRISKEKGIITLIKAWKDIKIKINIYGNGPLLNELRKNNSKSEIIFHGYLDQISLEKKMLNSKLLVFPSEVFETFGMTIIEAFMTGTLVIASNSEPIRSIIKNNYNGILFEKGNYKDLREKVNWALNNPAECDLMVNNALNDFKNKYTDEKNYESLFSIYKYLTKK